MMGLLVTFELTSEPLAVVGNVACILIETAFVILGLYAVRNERQDLTLAFMSCIVLLIAYVVVTCYYVSVSSSYSIQTTKPQFYVMSTLCLAVRIYLLYRTWKVMQNYNRGLRAYFDQTRYYFDFLGSSSGKLLDPARSHPVNARYSNPPHNPGISPLNG